MSLDQLDDKKSRAAKVAVDFLEPGTVVALGTGSTAQYVIKEIANRIEEGSIKDIMYIPSSKRTEKFAASLGIKLSGFDDISQIDINIDGADEVDTECNLIKGGGGALLKEKVIAQNSIKNIIVVGDSKLSTKLGEKWPLPVEVLPYAWRMEGLFLQSLGAEVELRKSIDGETFITDQNNYILDCNFGVIPDPRALDESLKARAGIIEHGLFIGTTTDLVVGRPDSVEHKQILR